MNGWGDWHREHWTFCEALPQRLCVFLPTGRAETLCGQPTRAGTPELALHSRGAVANYRRGTVYLCQRCLERVPADVAAEIRLTVGSL